MQGLWLKAAVFLFIITYGVFAQAAYAEQLVATIPVGNSPDAVAYDSVKGEIFVANELTSSISIISDSTNAVVATIPVGNSPIAVAYDSGKGEIFVANFGANTVSIISDSTNSPVVTIPVGSIPIAVAYDSGKGEIFVANTNANTVSIINDVTNTIVVSPTSGPTGTTVTVSGTAFLAFHSVIVKYDGTTVTTSPATVTTTASGAIPAGVTFPVPDSASGNHTVTVTDGTNSPTATYMVDSPIPEFSVGVIVLLVIVGAGIYLAMRYRTRLSGMSR